MNKTKKETKISRNEKLLTCRDSFSVKKVGGDLYVEGWANKAVVDRGKDLIKMEAWKLDNFKKVPVMLFNHNPDNPVGKFVDVRATDAGLWVKGKLSKSKDPGISRIRDLVQEGILNAFSVGFDCQDEEKDADGINNIKNAELYEVSVVTLPMNQDSVFSVSAKSLAGLSKEQAISKVLRQKGAWVAEAVHGKIFEEVKAGAKRDELLKAISDAASISLEDLTQILAGNVTPVPEKVLGAFATVLKMSPEELAKLDKGDVEESAKADQDSEDKPEGDVPPPEKSAEDMDKPKPEDEDKKPGKKELGVGVIGIMVPKEQAESAEQAAEMVSQAGYDASNVEESEEGYFAIQNDPSLFVDGQQSQIDLGGGIMAVIGVFKPEGSQEEAPEDKPEDAQEPPPDEESKSEGDEEEEPEEEDDKTKAANDAPIPGGTDGTITAENPALEQAKQTNILLGVLIQEIKGMSEKLDKISIEDVEDAHEETVSADEEDPDSEAEKAVMSNLRGYLVELETKLKKLGA